jgi:aminoglycoside phosphotransferase (APT) family kinase protein
MPPGPQQLSLETALDSCARIGAALHTSGLTVGPNRTLLSDIERTRAEVHAIAPFAPRLTAALEQRLADVSREAAEPALPSVLAHGDFTSAQILFDGPLSGLIDLDTVCMAEPALDLGQFVGYLDLTAAKARVSAGRPGGSADELSQLFLDDYLRANDGLADSRLYARVAAYRTLALVRVAVRSWRQLKPARVRLATDLLEQPSSVRIGALR